MRDIRLRCSSKAYSHLMKLHDTGINKFDEAEDERISCFIRYFNFCTLLALVLLSGFIAM